jgi:hypothetical protein
VADALMNDNWIQDIIYKITAPLVSGYVLLWELVEVVAFNEQDESADEIFWTRAADGSYSARSAYCIQFDGGTESSFPASVWKQWARLHHTDMSVIRQIQKVRIASIYIIL